MREFALCLYVLGTLLSRLHIKALMHAADPLFAGINGISLQGGIPVGSRGSLMLGTLFAAIDGICLQGGIPVGSRGTLFYNATMSPLPRSAAPQLRAGVNRWEAQVTLDMQCAQGLEPQHSDWWCTELEFDEVSACCLLRLSACSPWAPQPLVIKYLQLSSIYLVQCT